MRKVRFDNYSSGAVNFVGFPPIEIPGHAFGDNAVIMSNLPEDEKTENAFGLSSPVFLLSKSPLRTTRRRLTPPPAGWMMRARITTWIKVKTPLPAPKTPIMTHRNCSPWKSLSPNPRLRKRVPAGARSPWKELKSLSKFVPPKSLSPPWKWPMTSTAEAKSRFPHEECHYKRGRDYRPGTH